MSAYSQDYSSFKKAAVLSISAHVLLFVFILISPYLPKSSKKEMIQYVNLVGFPGGGGGGSGGGGLSGGGGAPPQKSEEMGDTEVLPRESLSELTTPQKFQEQEPSAFRYPVDKPKKDPKPKTKKKQVIQKTQNPSKKSSSSKQGSTSGSQTGGTGSGLSIGGLGDGTGGGFGSEYSSGIGISNFPFNYYLQNLRDRIASNWFKSRVSAGMGKDLFTSLYFRIQKDGEMTHLEVKERSGIRALDMNAMRAIMESEPFPPLPKAYSDEYLGIFLIFDHSQ